MSSIALPVFDLSTPSPELADAVVAAAHEYGFLFIRSTGLELTAAEIAAMFNLARTFFHQAPALKQPYAIHANRGWSSLHTEALDDTPNGSSHSNTHDGSSDGDPKECFNLGEFAPSGVPQQPLPPPLDAAAAPLAAFQARCRRLCLRILGLIGAGLAIDPTAGGPGWFAARHDPSAGPSGSILRLLHYPPVRGSLADDSAADDSEGGNFDNDDDTVVIRAGAHSDYGSVTLLFRRPGDSGLQIQAPGNEEGAWRSVPVLPPGTENDAFPPVLVNIGDLLSYWTAGWLRSTVHRVVSDCGSDAAERQSIAYFCHACDAARLEPVPSPVVEAHVHQAGGRGPDRGGRMGSVTAAEHLRDRLAATYRFPKS